MKKLIQGSVLTAVLAGIVAAPFAFAQPAAPGAAPLPHRERMHREAALKPADRVEARLAYYKTLLKITPAQEAQWTAVAEFARQQSAKMAADMQARRPVPPAPGQPHARPAPKSALERLDERQRHAQAMANTMAEFLTVARPLYASFSDDQKKVADEMLGKGFGGHRGHRGMGGHGMGGHDMGGMRHH